MAASLSRDEMREYQRARRARIKEGAWRAAGFDAPVKLPPKDALCEIARAERAADVVFSTSRSLAVQPPRPLPASASAYTPPPQSTYAIGGRPGRGLVPQGLVGAATVLAVAFFWFPSSSRAYPLPALHFVLGGLSVAAQPRHAGGQRQALKRPPQSSSGSSPGAGMARRRGRTETKAHDAPIIPGKRYTVVAKLLYRFPDGHLPSPPGVWKADRGVSRIVSAIDSEVSPGQPRFTRAVGTPQFHRDGQIVKYGDILHLTGFANERGELECRDKRVRQISTVAEVVARSHSVYSQDSDVFEVRGGKYPLISVRTYSPLLPGDVARLVGYGIRGRKTGEGKSTAPRCLHCETVEILSSRYARPGTPGLDREISWTEVARDYHDRKLRALFGDDFIAEIAIDPDKLDHPDLRLWRSRTKERLLHAAQQLWAATTVSAILSDHPWLNLAPGFAGGAGVSSDWGFTTNECEADDGSGIKTVFDEEFWKNLIEACGANHRPPNVIRRFKTPPSLRFRPQAFLIPGHTPHGITAEHGAFVDAVTGKAREAAPTFERSETARG